jgi:N-acetylneuraminic acid mutarotase
MWHTATRLADGRVLLVGGSQAVDDFLADVDIFDPTTGQTSRAASLHRARHAHSATLLPDGRVLVIGGYSLPWQWLDDAEVYDPAANSWTVVASRYSHGANHTATVMKDGRVLVVGGNTGSGRFTERTEVFDPQTNTWTEARPMPGERATHIAQLLEDGRVLVAGGQTNEYGIVGDALLYNPLMDTWTVTGPMVKPRLWAQSVRLQDGRVLVAGGMTLAEMPENKLTASVEIFNPGSNTWMDAPALSQPRYSHFLTLLPDGQVLALAGVRDWDCCWTSSSFVREIERYDPVMNEWRTIAELPQPRAQAAATLLLDGRVWLTGGRWSYTTHGADSWFIGYGAPGAP